MLVLKRNEGESIIIGGCIKVVAVRCSDTSCRLGVDAPLELPVHRSEIWDQIIADAAAEGIENYQPIDLRRLLEMASARLREYRHDDQIAKAIDAGLKGGAA